MHLETVHFCLGIIIMLNVRLIVVILNVVMLSVIILCVIILSAVVPAMPADPR